MNGSLDNIEVNTRIIVDSSECDVLFNVMPGRQVSEKLKICEFRIGSNWIEAEFDRTYESSMLSSPSHLTFVSALIQMQKLSYVYSCCKLGFNPDVEQPEVLKIWPTDINVVIRDLVREERLVHRMDFTGYRRVAHGKYLATATSRIGVLQIDASAIIMVLSDP